MSESRTIALDRLRHMLDAALSIAGYTDRGRTAFDEDRALQDAILYQIVVLGEAAKAVVRADTVLAEELSEIEWSLLARMRDRVAHRYWETDREVVWATAVKDIPELREILTAALARLS